MALPTTTSLILTLASLFCYGFAPDWQVQPSGTSARLRGVSAVSSTVAWASGSSGTWLRTTDGGKNWRAMTVHGAGTLDFRDIEAFDAKTAYLLSIGEGERSRIYKTTDAGLSWVLQFTNRKPKAFFDAMAFWDVNNGIAVSDPVDGRLVIIKTTDGGATWNEPRDMKMPAASEGEGAFAASGTCITVEGRNNVWIATGGKVARVFRSTNRGNTWEVADTPMICGEASTGSFSIAFRDSQNGLIVGGDYKKEGEARDNAARTTDGGRTWKLTSLPGGFRSGISYVREAGRTVIVLVGPSGSDYSTDDGMTWTSFGAAGYHALSFGRQSGGWAVGEGGRIGKFTGPFAHNR